jgi:hypothetical protein
LFLTAHDLIVKKILKFIEDPFILKENFWLRSAHLPLPDARNTLAAGFHRATKYQMAIGETFSLTIMAPIVLYYFLIKQQLDFHFQSG